MSEDGTRTGFGLGLGTDGTKSTAEKKIQVRLKSGKVYGPYQRSEVLSFIYAKKLTGDEMILVSDGSDWRPITSDIEFFDAFQEVLFGQTQTKKGTSPSIKGENTKVSSNTRSEMRVMEIPPDAIKNESTPKESLKYVPSSNPKVVDLGRGRSTPIPEVAPIGDGNLPPSIFSNPEGESAKGVAQKKNSRPLVVGAAFVLLVLILFFGLGPKKTSGNANSEVFGSFTAQSWYARPLALGMEGLSLSVSALPTQLRSSEFITFPEGFNALVWIEDLRTLESADPKNKLETAWWIRWSWNSYWLGLCLWTFDKKMGQSLMDHSLAIIARIEDMGLLKEPAASLFKGAQEIRNLQWEEASKSFDLVSAQSPIAAWLNEESKWQAFWANGAKGETPKRVVSEYESGPLETSSQVRSAFVDRDNTRYLDWTEQLAAQDPVSTTLWFTTAQVQWRFNKEGAQSANKLFTIGLGSLALQPQPFQLNYWTQFSEFLSLYGRQATTTKALNNRDAILKGNIERDVAALQKWWDLNQSEFDMTNLALEVFRRSEKGVVTNRDLATLVVLGYVIPGGGKALQVYNQLVRVDKSAVEGWGGLVWVYASLFKFSEAFEALDEVNKLKLDRGENIKFEALLHSLGREYEKATELFESYLRKAPNDPWAHYYNAKNYLAQEKNVQCVGAANLSLAHSQGELLQKSKLLLYRCRVLARIQVKEAITDLEKMVQDEPNNPAVAMELIDAQLTTDLDSSAADFADTSIRRFPRSFELRVKRADIYKKAGDFDRAVAYYQRAMKDRPDSIEPMLRIGEIYESQGKFLDAAQSFEAASVKNSDYPEVFLFSARAYLKAKKPVEAAKMFEREIENRPSYVGAFIEAAEFYLSNNDPNAVVRTFEKMTPDYQEHPRVRMRLAQAYLAMKQMDKAAEEAQRAIVLDPKIGEAHRVLGFVYDEQGQYELAKKHLENYILLIPGAIDADAVRSRISSPPYQ